MTDAETATLGHVRRVMWLRHVTNAELARRTGMDPNAISRLFRGQRQFRVKDLHAFADALDVAPERLLTGDYAIDLTADIEKAAV